MVLKLPYDKLKVLLKTTYSYAKSLINELSKVKNK